MISDSIARGLGDGAHFLILMGVLVVFYAAWGHFMFGPASVRWADASSSFFSVAMFFMYDYDYDAMAAAFPGMARLFYASFMFLMTNLMLWMLLAIFLESYTDVRAESHVRGPSAFRELAELVRNGGLSVTFKPGAGSGAAMCQRLRPGGGVGGSYKGGYGSGSSTGADRGSDGNETGVSSSAAFLIGAAAGAPPTTQGQLVQALQEARTGALRTDERITVGGLAVALGVTPAAAARLLLDAAAVNASGGRSRVGTEADG